MCICTAEQRRKVRRKENLKFCFFHMYFLYKLNKISSLPVFSFPGSKQTVLASTGLFTAGVTNNDCLILLSHDSVTVRLLTEDRAPETEAAQRTLDINDCFISCCDKSKCRLWGKKKKKNALPDAGVKL